MNASHSAHRVTAVLAYLLLSASCASAQDYPARPIRLVVPYPPGGPVDIVARLTAAKLGEQLSAQIVVDNRSGANGNIAGEIVSRSTPDGYTLLMGANGNIAVNPALYRKMPIDTVRDLTPVSLVATASLMLVVHPAVPAKTTTDLIALARSKPGSINFASSGIGSTAHLCSELLRMMTGIHIVHVPYKGSAPALNDVIAGQVQMLITGISSALPHARSGKLRALGVTSAKRLAALPEYPTIGETVPGYEVQTWYGVFGPASLPNGLLKRLHAAVVTAIGNKDVQDRLQALGADAVTSTPGQFAATIKEEITKWAKVVQSAGIKPE
jgi:tripartite-type tricarboxylate transporter receptor subunit TctC